MKMLIAIVKPFKLTDVKDALAARDIHRMTVVEVKGFGRQKGHTEIYRGSEYNIDFVPKIRIEIALDDSQVADAMQAIQNGAKTDTIGDGKIFILPMEEALRIRTGELGQDAL